MVTVTPGRVEGGEGVVGERGDDAGPQVAGRAELERHPRLGQERDQRRVLDRPDPVADPLRPEQSERLPDGLRPGRLAGVGDRVQTGGADPGEVGGEGRRRVADFVAAEPERDDAVRLVQPDDPVDGAGDGGGAGFGVADAVGDPAHLDAEPPSVRPSGVHPGQHGVEVEAALADVRLRVEMDFQVADVLGRRVLAQLADDPGEVLRLPQRVADGDVALDEVGEVAEAEERREARLVGDRESDAVRRGQLEHGPWPDGPFEVEVELRFRHPLDEPVERVRRSVPRHACLHRAPIAHDRAGLDNPRVDWCLAPTEAIRPRPPAMPILLRRRGGPEAVMATPHIEGQASPFGCGDWWRRNGPNADPDRGRRAPRNSAGDAIEPNGTMAA
jgi:hypothetical protein